MYKYKPLVVLILLLLLIKFGILLSLSDMAMIINDDELFYGGVAKEILNGPILPLFDYQVRPWEGGGLIVSIIASFCFFLFGDSLFSLKLIGIFFVTFIDKMSQFIVNPEPSERNNGISGLTGFF